MTDSFATLEKRDVLYLTFIIMFFANYLITKLLKIILIYAECFSILKKNAPQKFNVTNLRVVREKRTNRREGIDRNVLIIRNAVVD